MRVRQHEPAPKPKDVPARAAATDGSGILALHRAAGNRAVARLVAGRRVLARKKYSEKEISTFVDRYPPGRRETLEAYLERIREEELPKADRENLPAIGVEAQLRIAARTQNAGPVVTQPFNFGTFTTEHDYERDRGRTVYLGYKGEGSHRPKGAVYVKGDFAISEDQDEHAPGGVMKGFSSTAQGWRYAGTFDAQGNRVRRQAASTGGGMGVDSIP